MEQKGSTLLTGATDEAPKPATDAKDAPKSGTPTAYADYKVPEGFTLDPEVKGEADAVFKDLGLSQEGAQKLVDFYTKQTTDAANQPYEAYKKMVADWGKESSDHPDLRGKIGPGKEISVRISKMLDGLGDPTLAQEFRAHMDLTGAGNYHAFIRVLDKVSQLLGEGTHVSGSGPSAAGQRAPGQASRTAAQDLYPNLPSSQRAAT